MDARKLNEHVYEYHVGFAPAQQILKGYVSTASPTTLEDARSLAEDSVEGTTHISIIHV